MFTRTTFHIVFGKAIICLASAAIISTNADAQADGFQYMYPPSGAKYVCPQVELIVRTGRPITAQEVSALERTEVVGSISGMHAVRVSLVDRGTVALLHLPVELAPGETVSVHYGQEPVGQDGRAVGQQMSTFEVSRTGCAPQERPSDLLLPGTPRVVTELPSSYPNIQSEELGPHYNGRIFLAPMVSSHHLLILESDGSPFYHSDPSITRRLHFGPINDSLLYYGDPGIVAFVLADAGLNVLDTVTCQNGYSTDLHDFVYKANGNRVLMSYDPQSVDMSAVVPGGNPAAIVEGLVLQELDPQDNLLFQWRSWDHFQITDAQSVGALPFNFTGGYLDPVHGNSIDVLADGDLLISSRHMNEVTRIDRATGAVVWRMGGANNQFSFINDPLNGFHSQHDARMLPNGHITIFDNGLGHTPPRTRVVEYALDEQAHTATLVWSYQNLANQPTVVSGNAQRLPNGNTFINWSNPVSGTNLNTMLEEVDPAGNPVFRLHVPTSSPFEWSYRAYRYAWNGNTGPSVAQLSLKVFLEGPFNGVGQMTDGLRVASLLPSTEPYSALGYAFTGSPGAGGAVPTGVFAVTGNNAIVDWVVVELRGGTDPSVVVASCAALVQSDGDVVALDGVSPVAISVAMGQYHVAIRHRNHLGAMTANTVVLDHQTATVDFTTAALTTYGTDAQRLIGSAYALRTGDVTFDHQVRYTGSNNDRDPILVRVGSTTPNNVVSGYHTEDTNLNGTVSYTGSGNDRDPVLVNVGSTTPNNIRIEQLP